MEVRKAVQAAVGAVAAAQGIAAHAPAAGAYPNPHHEGCGIAQLDFEFRGGNWAGWSQDWLDGAARWDGVSAATGGAFTSSGQGISHDTWRMDLGGGTLGRRSCLGGGAGLMDFFLDAQVAVGHDTRRVASHEAGHGHSLFHSGRLDSVGAADTLGGGAAPAMATCIAIAGLPEALSSDDFAHLAERYTNTVHANASFENGSFFWRVSNGTLTPRANGGSDGPRYVQFDATAQGAFISQTIRHEDPASYKVRANYRDRAVATTGTITVEIATRQTTFPNNAMCGDDNDPWINSWGLNNPDTIGAFEVRHTRTYNVGDNWAFNNDFPLWTAPDAWKAADIRIRVYKNTNGFVDIDNFRAYEAT